MKNAYRILVPSAVAVTVMGRAHKTTLALRQFVIYCTSPSELQSFVSYSPELSGNYQHRYLIAKLEKLGKK
jgi:hypothetical protein